MIYTCICIYSDGECPLSLGRLSLLSLTLGSSRLEARLACVRGMTTCQRLATALAALILLTHLAF